MIKSIKSIEKNATTIRLPSSSHVQHEYVGHTRSQSLPSVHLNRMKRLHHTYLVLHLTQRLASEVQTKDIQVSQRHHVSIITQPKPV